MWLLDDCTVYLGASGRFCLTGRYINGLRHRECRNKTKIKPHWMMKGVMQPPVTNQANDTTSTNLTSSELTLLRKTQPFKSWNDIPRNLSVEWDIGKTACRMQSYTSMRVHIASRVYRGILRIGLLPSRRTWQPTEKLKLGRIVFYSHFWAVKQLPGLITLIWKPRKFMLVKVVLVKGSEAPFLQKAQV